MSAQLQSIINQAQNLTEVEQIQLISMLSSLLQRKHGRTGDFWKTKTIAELVDDQKANAVNRIADLRTDFWPNDESVDDFNEFIQEQRRHDRLSE